MRTKKFLTAALIAMCAMAATVFTSCGSDDSDDNGGSASKEVKSIKVRYVFSVTEQMASLCDYTIVYYGSNDKLVTEDAVWNVKDGVAIWIKDVTTTQIPCTVGARLNIRVKEGAQLEGVRINNIYPETNLILLKGVSATGQTVWTKDLGLTGVSTHANATGEKLPEYIARWDQRGGVVNHSYIVDKDGNYLVGEKIAQ